MGRYYLTKESSRYTIRNMDGTRYPRHKYTNLCKEDIEKLVIRLNHDTAESVLTRHAFINTKLLDDYYEVMLTRIPTKKDAYTKFNYLKATLEFFISLTPDPKKWEAVQHKWGTSLLASHYSKKVIKQQVWELNRFMLWLHKKRPEMPVIVLEPLSRAALKTKEAMRQKRQNRVITESDMYTIMTSGDPIVTLIYIAYYYGLRRNEVLGLRVGDVRQDYLSIERQWKGAPLKSREIRRVPHWFCTPTEIYGLIESIFIMHPDTVSAKFSALCRRLKLPPYIFHDLRRTWATHCIRKGIKPLDLKFAIGHVSLETTSKFYIENDLEMGSTPFKPSKTA